MLKTLSILLAAAVVIHGLIHLPGFIAYFPLAKMAELPYKTTLLDGRLAIGAAGMRVYSLLWLLAALGLAASSVALVSERSFWAPLMLGAALLSLILCILDGKAAFRGAWIDAGLLLVLFFVFGFRVPPAPFTAYHAPAAPVTTVRLPTGLPAPVERFYRQAYGEAIPVYTSAVMSGRGTIRFMGITMPGRLRFTHVTGHDYRHYMEATFYGFPIFKVNEHYLDGHGRLALPFGVVEKDPHVDSAANQGLWAEMASYPASLLTDPRVRWEALDDTSARLYVPFGKGEQSFIVKFDPDSGALNHIETLRYRDEKAGNIRWWGDITAAETAENGSPTLQRLSVTWEDEGTPWLVYDLEDAIFNTDVSTYVRQTGP